MICRDYSKTYARAKYFDEVKPWNERCDVAFPCASQNEVDQADAINLVNGGCRLLVEGRYFLYQAIFFSVSRFVFLSSSYIVLLLPYSKHYGCVFLQVQTCRVQLKQLMFSERQMF